MEINKVMRRDTLKTFGAILLILIIVGVTFWYGNRQRQAQVKSDQATQQVKKSTASTQVAKPAPAPATTAPAPAAAPAPTSTPQTGSSLAYLIPVAALVAGLQAKRASSQALKRSLRTA